MSFTRTWTSVFALGALCCGLALGQDAEPRDAEPRPQPAKAPQKAPLPAADRDAGEASLVHAYQKEFAFLANEERALSGRLGELDLDRERRLTAEDAVLAMLEEQLREERAALEGVRAELEQLDLQDLSLDEGDDSIDALASQIEATRTRYGRAPLMDVTEDPSTAQKVAVVEQGLSDVNLLLTELSSVRRETGRFFLPDGRSTEGELLHLGAIATLGVGPDAAGTLAPAGDGGLMLWPVETADAARAALEGPLPEVLPLYLYESTEKLAEQPHEKTFGELVEKAGVVGYVIVALGVLAAFLVLLRIVLLALAAGKPDRLLARVTELVRGGESEAAFAAVKRQRSCAGRVLAAMFPHLRESPDQLESAASGAILRETTRIERFDTAIMVSAAVAPLLGLLGTVTGMISTFDVITVFGTGDPKLLSGGISEALITTQLGLSVAIPTLLAGNLVSGWAEGIRSSMERTALQTALLAAELRPEPVAPVATSLDHGADEDTESGDLFAVVTETDEALEPTQSVGNSAGRHVSAQLPGSARPVTPTAATASAVGHLKQHEQHEPHEPHEQHEQHEPDRAPQA